MKQVRLGVIGCGNIGRVHMGYLNQVEGLKFAAASEAVPASLQQAVQQYDVEGFDDSLKMMDSGRVDAVLIATPHYFHPEMAIAALERGLHVLTEKPVAVTAKAAAEVETVHAKHPELVYAAMFQLRSTPLWRKLKQLIDEGQLGRIQRFNWIVTNWFRTQIYYDSGTWRATWKGEGGGVLLNQCPHNLDALCWLLGSPQSVHAHVSLGKYHHIEVEDEVSAYLEWKGGATGVFITTTGEAPGTDRLEIVGDQGKLVVENGQIDFTHTLVPVSEFCKTSNESFGSPAAERITIQPNKDNPGHNAVTQNFVNAILRQEPLISSGESGIHGLELGNAMLMSGLTGQTVKIPTNRNAFDKLLKDLIAKSKFKKGAAKQAQVDMEKSYHSTAK